MKRFIAGFLTAVVLVAVIAMTQMRNVMFAERVSPFGLEETIARVQRNIEETKGWKLVGLRSPSASIRAKGAYVPDTVLIETCNTDYSKPILADDSSRILSILIPCKVAVYKKKDGKVYIGTMRAGIMGWFFGLKVGQVMSRVARDQKNFYRFDPSRPTPKIKVPEKSKAKGGPGGIGGC